MTNPPFMPMSLVFALAGGLVATLLFLVGREALRHAVASAKRQADATEATRRSTVASSAASTAAGATPEHAIEVGASSVILSMASRLRCIACDRDMQVRHERVAATEGGRLRIVELECRWCSAPRVVYFRLSPRDAHVLH